jgi:hypothetical protein
MLTKTEGIPPLKHLQALTDEARPSLRDVTGGVELSFSPMWPSVFPRHADPCGEDVSTTAITVNTTTLTQSMWVNPATSCSAGAAQFVSQQFTRKPPNWITV